MPRIRAHQRHPSPRHLAETATTATLLHARLDRLADDAWVLARRSPALAADPALVRAADTLLLALRRLLRREPGHRLLPDAFAPGIALHALALALRQMQAALAPFVARHAPPPRSTADEIDDITRIEALILRNIAADVAEHYTVPLPPGLKPKSPARLPLPPPPAGQPPPPRPRIRQTMLRRRNARRRGRRTAGVTA